MKNEEFVETCENYVVGFDLKRRNHFLICESKEEFCPYRGNAITETGSENSCGYYNKNNLWGEENE